jgi:signal transduction histidine kinase/ActR/RegA family two-component response regulator
VYQREHARRIEPGVTWFLRMGIGWIIRLLILAVAAAAGGYLLPRRRLAERTGRRGVPLCAFTEEFRGKPQDLDKPWRFIEEERRVVEMMGRGALPQEVLDTLTHAVEKMEPDCLCTILLLDEDGRHLQKGSGGSLPSAYMDAVNGMAIGPDIGACGSAAFRNETVIVEDVATDYRFAGPARDFVMSFGLRACWSVPIRDSNHQVLGTFAMYHRYPAKPTADQLMLVEVGAHLAGNAIERLHATAKLREYAERIDLSERAASFGIWEIVNDRLTFSDGFAAMVGLSDGPREMPVKQWRSMIHPDDMPNLTASVREAVARGETFHHEARVRLPDGSVHWHRVHGKEEYQGERRKRVIGASIDVTREKEMMIRLEQAMRTKSEFLAHISHEIRTPMNGLLGSISLLLDSGVTAEQREYLDTIRSCGDSLLQLVNDILDLSKIEAGKLRLERIPFPVVELAKRTVSVVVPMATARGLVVRLDLDENLPRTLIGDPQRLHQTLLNLLSNAVKFTEQGSITMGVAVREHSGSGIEVEFTVKDTGIGIPQEAQQAIFEPFTQADSSTTRRFGGTGLGLTICRQLVALMNGRLELESVPGSGSTFRISIPFEIAAESAAVYMVPTDCIARSSRCLRVLLAEDNPINQKVAAGLLHKMGHRVDIVGDGRKAIAAVAQGHYDVVLMDCQMPDIDGYAAARAICASTGGRLPIIALTAHATAEDRQLCLDAGMIDYISKPIAAERLFELLESCRTQAECTATNPA